MPPHSRLHPSLAPGGRFRRDCPVGLPARPGLKAGPDLWPGRRAVPKSAGGNRNGSDVGYIPVVNTRFRALSQLVTVAGIACLALAAAGPANADDLNTTTCSDQQIMSSLQQNDPMIWGRISANPKLEEELRVGLAVLLAAPPGQRQEQANTLEQTLGYQHWSGVSDDIMDASNGPIGRAVNNCHNY